MPSLNDLLRPQGDRHPKAEQSSASLQFTRQQSFLTDHRYELLSCDAQCCPLEQQRKYLLDQVLGVSHIATWYELFPLVEVIHRALPPANLACIFGLCADGTTVSPTNIKPLSELFCEPLWMLSVHIQFASLAQSNQEAALRWHAKQASRFNTRPGATVEQILAEINQRRDNLESSLLRSFLWLKADAISFLPEPGKPGKGWAEAYRFLWAFQQLPSDIHEQLNPCQLLVARLQPASPAK